MDLAAEYFKGRGSQVNPNNKFLEKKYASLFEEGIDEEMLGDEKTKFFSDNPKKIISENKSPDISFMRSINPYQGCEHGCIYCYARNSHEYWGFSAGLDFERKIMVKHQAPELLEKAVNCKNYQPATIVLSGNPDCYEPEERKHGLTGAPLGTFHSYHHRVARND